MITVEPYQDEWRRRFQDEKARLESVFSGLPIQFHHIGSTSVAGCSAKPIIDILGVTPDAAAVDNYNSGLEALGYAPMGEFGMKQRRFFRRAGCAHVHIFEDSDPEVCRHLRFSAYLNAHPDAANAYSGLKKKLASTHPEDMESYILGKEKWIKEIDFLAVKTGMPPLAYPPLGPRKKKWNSEQIIDALHVNMHLHMTYYSKYHPRIQLVYQPDATVVQTELKDDMVN